MAGRLFVSYASRDQLIADAIYDYFKSQRMQPWMASRDIPAGAAYPNQIVQALAQSDLLLLVLTPNANASEQIPLELSVAKTRRLPILPVRLQLFEFSTTLQYFLGASQWFDASAQPWDQHLPQICQKARELLDGTDASAFFALQATLEALPSVDAAPMRDAIRWGQNHALVARLTIRNDSPEVDEHRRRLEQECRRFARRLDVDESTGTSADTVPAEAQPRTIGSPEVASFVTSAARDAELIELRILVRHGLRISSAFSLGFRLLMIGQYLQGLPSNEQAKVLAGLSQLSEAAGLPLTPIEQLTAAVREATSIDNSARVAIDELLRTLEDYALYRRTIALQRANLWEFGRKVSLLSIAQADGASDEILRPLRAKMQIFAAALKVDVPAIKPGGLRDATAQANALHYLLHDVGKSVGPQVHDLYGMRFSSLLECSLKSTMLFWFYSPDAPRDQTTQTLIGVVERSARAAALPSETWMRVLELISDGAPYDEVRDALWLMQNKVADYLHGLAASAPS